MITEKLTTFARPYAQAAFEYALENNDLASWEMMLQNAALITLDKNMLQLLDNPAVTQDELVSIYTDLLAKTLDAEKKNFIHLLVENGRLMTLPEIVNLFATHREEHDKTITVQVSSAIVLDETYKQKISAALTRRLRRKVSLECTVDATLLGGAMIRAGDMVIDGSTRGKLNRLLESLGR